MRGFLVKERPTLELIPDRNQPDNIECDGFTWTPPILGRVKNHSMRGMDVGFKPGMMGGLFGIGATVEVEMRIGPVGAREPAPWVHWSMEPLARPRKVWMGPGEMLQADLRFLSTMPIAIVPELLVLPYSEWSAEFAERDQIRRRIMAP